MEATLIGEVQQSAVALVGTFDPFSNLHRQMIEQATAYACESGMTCVAIVIDPSPSYYLQCPPRCLTYDHLDARLKLLQRHGCSAQLLVQFTLNDLSFGADEFFKTVMASIPLRELWLGCKQSLGSGHRGSSPYLDQVAAKSGVRVARLKHVNTALLAGRVRSLLESGNLSRAAIEVGRTPIWNGACREMRANYWALGQYCVSPFEFVSEETLPDRLAVELISDAGGGLQLIPRADLPEWITFVSGPNDLT